MGSISVYKKDSTRPENPSNSTRMTTSQALFLSAIVLALLCAIAHSQLTFSPYWGKRSSGDVSGGAAGLFGPPEDAAASCRNANEVLKDIFRFIQVRAQLFAECNRGQ